MNRIALFLPNWIGDVVMATPAIRAIRETFPAAELLAVCKPYVADVLGGNPWFQDVLPADKRGPRPQQLLAVASRLRQKRPEASVLFQNSLRSALTARIAGCRTVIGNVRYGRKLLLSHRLYAKTDTAGRFVPSPAIDDYNRLARELGTPDPGYRMQLFTTPPDETAAQAVWNRFGLARYPRVVLLNPGAAFGAAKHWPADSFAQLARLLVQQANCGVLVLCGPSERDLARRIVEASRSPHAYSLHDMPLSLGLSKACVRRSDLLVTTDSGPRHFAAAFGRPVVTLFGPTHIAWTETYYPRAVHLQKKVPCGPCQQRVCPLDHRCMKDLSAGEVFAAVERLLARLAFTPGREPSHAA
jgi:heptosyltransferase-2